MTVDEAKVLYGRADRRFYVFCTDCPVKEECLRITEAAQMDGLEKCWSFIARHMSNEEDTCSEVTPDNVNHPAHYETGKFECIDVMVETQGEEAVKAYCLCAAFKYLYRHRRKNGLEDIKKARWYLDKYVELEEGEADG